ncbi:MAG: dienelactone hydrolase family protein, partial [Candidatus Margulisbacteria bacterium]|nr:dienelactone hydrolase family protein [Candidatus Margulisiibacteriota bacterium]
YNYLVHAVAAARNGITFLSNRKEVNPQRIGMIGLSWGGVLTILTNGMDDRLRAAVNVFGAGYIPEGCTWEEIFTAMPANDKNLWNNFLDPKNFLATQHAPILFITGTNDHCYYLTTFQKSYEDVTAPKKFLLIPNLRHKFTPVVQSPALVWLDQKLKTGGSFPVINELPVFTKGADKVLLSCRVEVHSTVKSAKLYYALGGPQEWTDKKWKELPSHQENGIYFFSISTNLIKPEIMYYMTVKDNHGGVTSSLVRSLFAVKLKDGRKTYAYTAPIERIYRHQTPITLIGTTESRNIGYIYSKPDLAYLTYENPN